MELSDTIAAPVRSLALSSLLLGLLMTAGCYNPSIGEGAFLCGPGGSCPDGFRCDGTRCYKNKPAGDAGEDTGGCKSQELECSAASGSTGGCDPVCQSGCACGEKCTNSGSGNRCAPIGLPVRGFYDSCDPSGDRCRPGAACLPEFQERCGAHCYRFCRVDSDCGEVARCTGEAQDDNGNLLYKVCSAKIEQPGCNPTGPNPACSPSTTPDRPASAFGCYILSHLHPDETVCECSGLLPEGAACAREYQCAPGNECLKVGAETKCRKLCTLEGSGILPPTVCPVGQRCNAFAGARKFGFCLPAI
jgi:hypothetical protein